MAFPPTRYRDINTWLPYFSERITPVVPTRLCDAHFYTIGPHVQLHHLDYVILQRHHQLVHSFQQEQLTFWTQIHRDTGRLMHTVQFYHHHLHTQNHQGGLTDFLYVTAGNRAKELMHTAKYANRDLRRHQEIPVWLKNQILWDSIHSHPFMQKITRRHSISLRIGRIKSDP